MFDKIVEHQYYDYNMTILNFMLVVLLINQNYNEIVKVLVFYLSTITFTMDYNDSHYSKFVDIMGLDFTEIIHDYQ